MKIRLLKLSAVIGLGILFSATAFAATGKEQSFIDSYKKAFEAKDEATLKGFLYTKGADPEILEFYTMMLTAEMGGTITSIELAELSAEDLKKALEAKPGPSGGMAKLPVNPSKKLVMKIETKDANGTSTSTSQTFVAEVDGKFMIPVPGPVH